MHFPALHRANLKSRFGMLKKPNMSAKQQGKQPVKNKPAMVEHVNDMIDVPDTNVPEQGDARNKQEASSPRVFDSDSPRVTTSLTAAQFLAQVRSENTDPSTLTEAKQAVWVREKYTDFKNRSTGARIVQAVKSGSIVSPPSQTIEASDEHSPRVQSRQSLDLVGIGGAWSLSIRTCSVRASVASVSDQLSDTSTVIDDNTTIASGTRLSWQEQPQHARHSLNVFPLPRFRHSLTKDSMINSEAFRNYRRPESSTTSQPFESSTVRPSVLRVPLLNASQASIESHDSRDHTIA